MTNGINPREMILEILLQIEEGEHSHIAIRSALSKSSVSAKHRNGPLSQEFARELWNTGSRLIIFWILFQK